MEYVHEVNNEFKENLKMMLCSPDPETISLALGILNHVNLSNEETHKNISELIADTDCGLCVALQDPTGYFKTLSTTKEINDINIKDFYFYSSNLLMNYIKKSI